MASNAAAGAAADTLRHGQALYRGHDFKSALQYFNTVIASEDVSTLFTALDNRSATYTKLGDLESALRDGKRMIQVDKSSSVGYIRTSRILQLLKDDAVAFRICSYGLRNVPHGDQYYGLLQARHSILLSSSKPADPVVALPVEMVLKIMLHLDFATIVKLLGVSQSWKSMLISFPELWRDLDFSCAKKTAPMSTVSTYAKRSRWTATRAHFPITRTCDIEVMGWVMNRCKALRRVEVTTTYCKAAEMAYSIGISLVGAAGQASNLKTLVLSSPCEIHLSAIPRLLGNLTSLERAEFQRAICDGTVADWRGDMSKIRELVMNAASNRSSTAGRLLNLVSTASYLKSNLHTTSKMYQAALSAKIPNVKFLTLGCWSWVVGNVVSHMELTGLTKLESLKIISNTDVVFPILPPSLQELDFGRCVLHRALSTMSYVHMKTSPLPKLTDLRLERFHLLRYEELLALLSASKGKLETLNLEACVGLSGADIRSLIEAGYLNKVQHLVLGDCAVDDKIAELLAKKLHHLRSINLRATRVTGVGVKALVLNSHTKLERLVVSQCQGVQRDAVDFAMEHGVLVDYGFIKSKDWKGRFTG